MKLHNLQIEYYSVHRHTRLPCSPLKPKLLFNTASVTQSNVLQTLSMLRSDGRYIPWTSRTYHAALPEAPAQKTHPIPSTLAHPF
jgi:hypothetical protein